MTPAYRHGRRAALEKLGMLTRAVGGAALGGLAGYALAPEDRKGVGFTTGAALSGLGSALAPVAARVVAERQLTALERAGAAALGGTAGLGLSQFSTSKNIPDRSEDPYRYRS